MISSPNNPSIRRIRRLQKRREREREGAVLVEGHRALAAALRAKATVREVLHTPSAAGRRGELLREARDAGVPVAEASPEVVQSLTSLQTAPDVVSVAEIPRSGLEEVAARGLRLAVVLAGVRDPATAGSILASCAAAGGEAAIATTGTVDLLAPKAIRSAAGAHFVLALAWDADPGACARALRASGVRLAALDRDGEDPAAADLRRPLAVVVGEEGALALRILAEAADLRVAIPPGPGGVRASVAAEAAVVLFEAARRDTAVTPAAHEEDGRG